MKFRSNVVVALVSVTLLASSAQAATVTYVLDLTVANVFTLTAQASLGDNAGITTYGIPLTGTVLTLDHRTPQTFNLANFSPAGFFGLRSLDGNTPISGPTITGNMSLPPNPNQLTGFGQVASNWAAKGVIPGGSVDVTNDAAWLAPLVIATGTYNSTLGTLGINTASADLLASVYQDSAGQVRIPADVVTQVIPNTIPEPSPPPGDYNRDLTADAADYLVWRKFIGYVVPACSGADANCNGFVEFNEDETWRQHFGESAIDASLVSGGSSNNVPEPSSLLLLFVAAGLILSGRRFCRP